MTEVCIVVEDVHGHWLEHSHFGGTADMKLTQLAEWLRELDSTYEDDAPRWRISTHCPDGEISLHDIAPSFIVHPCDEFTE